MIRWNKAAENTSLEFKVIYRHAWSTNQSGDKYENGSMEYLFDKLTIGTVCQSFH